MDFKKNCMVRLRPEDRALLDILAREMDVSQAEVLHIALDKLRKAEFFRRMNDAEANER